MTETGHGSDVAALRTTATYDAEHRRARRPHAGRRARKDYIGNAARDGRHGGRLRPAGHRRDVARRARDPRAAPRRAGKPVARHQDRGLRAQGRAQRRRQRPDLVRPGAGAARGAARPVRPGRRRTARYTSPIDNPSRRFFTMLGTLVRGRISVAAASASATKTALTIATRYADAAPPVRPARRRRRGGPARLRGAPATADPGAGHVVRPALRPGGAGAGAARPARAGRRRATWTSRPSASSRPAPPGSRPSRPGTRRRRSRPVARRAAGTAIWSRRGCPQLKADTDVFTTFEGDNTVLLQLVAKGLITGYRNDFGALDTLGTVRFVADQLVGSIVERTAVRTVVGTMKQPDLLDRGWQRSALQDRERHIVEGLARRLRRAGKGERRRVRGVQRRPAASARRRAGPRRGRGAGGVRAGDRPMRGSRCGAAAVAGLRPLCADHDRGRPGLVPGARPALGGAGQGRAQGGRPALRVAAPAGGRRSSTPGPSPTTGSARPSAEASGDLADQAADAVGHEHGQRRRR